MLHVFTKPHLAHGFLITTEMKEIIFMKLYEVYKNMAIKYDKKKKNTTEMVYGSTCPIIDMLGVSWAKSRC